jgi:hypothetical protein
MGASGRGDSGERVGEGAAPQLELVREATAPARWLLDAAASDGMALTQTYALARAVVREAAERWPHWWDAELFGPPHREAEVPVLEALHDGLRRLRLVRRRGRTLHASARGRALAADPARLLDELASDLGGGDAFTEMLAESVIDTLAAQTSVEHDELVTPALYAARRGGWRDPAGNVPDERDVSWVVSEVLCRGEAYGLIERNRDPGEPRGLGYRISLSAAAAHALPDATGDADAAIALIFYAELVSVPGVSARVAVARHRHLTALHDAIQEAFGWADDHLYSFWLDGHFWGDAAAEFVRPGTPDSDRPTADVPLAELDLKPGAKIAYLFDYGDEWRVTLTLGAQVESPSRTPRVIERRGTAPPQYPPLEEE